MTTSSRKGMLPVRLGIEPDNKSALEGLGLNPELSDKMNDKQLDEYVIEEEYKRVIEYYKSKGKEAEGVQAANEFRSKALKQINTQ